MWDDYIEKLRKSNLPKSEISKAIEGFEFLRSTLGERFLIDNNNEHPLYIQLATATLQTLLRISNLGNNLKAISILPGYKRVKQDFISCDHFSGAEAEIILMGRFLQNGKEIEIIDTAQRTKKFPIPDFKTKIEKRWIEFEVSTIQELNKSIKSSQMNMKLRGIKPINSKGEGFFIQINVRHLSPDNVEAQFNDIKRIIEEIIEDQYQFEGFIADRVYVRINKSDYVNVEVTGPRVIMEIIGRIFIKTSNKFKKFRSDNPGVLWISTNYDYFANEIQVKGISSTLHNDIVNFENISAICYVTIMRGPQDILNCEESKDVIFRQKKYYDETLTESVLFIKNPGANFLLENSEVNQILSSYFR